MTTPSCQVGHCPRRAVYRVENTGTGKVWVMCEEHTAGFNREPFTKRERITDGTARH